VTAGHHAKAFNPAGNGDRMDAQKEGTTTLGIPLGQQAEQHLVERALLVPVADSESLGRKAGPASEAAKSLDSPAVGRSLNPTSFGELSFGPATRTLHLRPFFIQKRRR